MIYTKGRVRSDEFLTADSTLQPMPLYRSVQQDFQELFHEGALACRPWDVSSRRPIQGCEAWLGVRLGPQRAHCRLSFRKRVWLT